MPSIASWGGSPLYRPRAATDLAGALGCDREAVALLTLDFERLPQSYAGPMAAIYRGYLDRCEAAGIKPDGDLLAPVLDVLNRMQAAEEKEA